MEPEDELSVEWDDGNESELARHRISPIEVVQVLEDEDLRWLANKGGRSGDSKVIGRTYGGRILSIIVKVDSDGTIRPITGWDATTGERTLLRRRR